MKKSLFIILLSLFLLSLSGCRSHKKGKSDVVIEDAIRVELPAIKGERQKLVEEAISWVGTPYGYGHSEKGVATDCSGLVWKVYGEIMGIEMPRNSAKQAEFCKEIEHKHIQPGDLVFFSIGSNDGTISHVGIMIDKEKFVHASSSKGVIISEMTTPYYIRNFKMYGKVK